MGREDSAGESGTPAGEGKRGVISGERDGEGEERGESGRYEGEAEMAEVCSCSRYCKPTEE